MEFQPHQPFNVGRWRVDPRLDVISSDGSTTKLVPKTMEVLCCLARHAGDVVSAEQIEKAVWPGVLVTSSSIYQAIADLRRALGDDRQRPAYIATVPRKGYRLIAPVQVIAPGQLEAETSSAPHAVAPQTTSAASSPSPAAPEPDEVAPGSRAAAHPEQSASVPLDTFRWHKPQRHWIAPVAALLLAAVIGVVAYMRPQSAPPATAAPEPKSIAVLPVVDISEGHQQEAFADGLTEEMLNTLAQVPGLRVTARTSAFAFKGRNEDVREIGRALGTRYVLEGSIRRGEGRIRVTAQLVDALNGYHLWSKTYDRPEGDVLAVQEQIANEVAASLRVTLSVGARQQLAARRPVNVGSYDMYLLGRHYQLQRNPESVVRAIRYHKQALEADPGFALAYAGLADAEMATYYYSNRPLDEVKQTVEPLVTQGLEINPKLPELYAARAVLETEQRRFGPAEHDLEQALELNPNYAEAWVRLGAVYEYDGRPRDALAAYSRAAALDPLHFILHTRRCLTLQNLGRYAEANAACDRAIELDREHPNAYLARALVALSSGELADAIAGYREALARAPQRVDLLGQVGWLYLDVGRPRQADEMLDRATRITGIGPNFGYLTRGRYFLATSDIEGLRRHLSVPELAGEADAESLLDLAELELIAGRREVAQRYFERARTAEDFNYDQLFNDWYARWGVSGVLTLAVFCNQVGDDECTARHLDDLSAYLEKLERNGLVWHGLHYLEACILSMRGQAGEALAQLEEATRLGWRRSWWPRLDPALDNLKSDPRFEKWLNTLDRNNEKLRAQVLTVETRAARAGPATREN